jgi:hypothetical protein
MKGYCRFTYRMTVVVKLSLSLAIHSSFSREREVSKIQHDPTTNCNQERLTEYQQEIRLSLHFFARIKQFYSDNQEK